MPANALGALLSHDLGAPLATLAVGPVPPEIAALIAFVVLEMFAVMAAICLGSRN